MSRHRGPNRLMKNGVCRGAKPLCRESEGVPQIQFLPPSWPRACPESIEGKGVRGMVERVFQHLAKGSMKLPSMQATDFHGKNIQA